ncbi:putative retinol dehydrogenase 7 isoform X2 [Apostichopus japonicus]|uniref:Putative retinol dehydrogenase 7 isoform X2 n=1 Tax=Stichopus japonicus TaxID=307972 RepID=A0A2G8KXX0_STIJA|nr:putative retinol dehydrogenase 7 isoform X2 [Apostichopus japonicus]
MTAVTIAVLAIVALLIGKTLEWLIRKLTVPLLTEKYVLITGCDSGFGNLLAKQLDKKGMHVIACCFTSDGKKSLESTTSKKLTTLGLDVSSHDSVLECYESVKKILPVEAGLWGLVNNAGVTGFVGPMDWCDLDSYSKIVRVNLLGVVDMTLTFLPLIYKASGRVVNISSSYGRFPMISGGYSEAKFGVESFTDGLRMHFKSIGSPCYTSVLEPGHFRTPVTDQTAFRKSLYGRYSKLRPEIKSLYPSDAKAYIERMADENDKTLDILLSSRIHLVTDAYEHALISRYPKKRYAVGWDARLIWVPLSYTPSWVTDLIIPNFMNRKIN